MATVYGHFAAITECLACRSVEHHASVHGDALPYGASIIV